IEFQKIRLEKVSIPSKLPSALPPGGICGCSSGVERNLAKVDVVSSNLITRSSFSFLFRGDPILGNDLLLVQLCRRRHSRRVGNPPPPRGGLLRSRQTGAAQALASQQLCHLAGGGGRTPRSLRRCGESGPARAVAAEAALGGRQAHPGARFPARDRRGGGG